MARIFNPAILRGNLRRLRVRAGLTQPQLAEQVGVTWSSISGYECGKNVPPLVVLVRLADCLDCKLDELVLYEIR